MNRRQKLVQKQFLYNEQAIIKRLDTVYKRSLTDIEEKVKHLTFTIGKLQTEYDWLDDDDPEKVRIKSMIQSKIYQKNFQEQLQVQLEGILQRMHVGQVDNITDYLDTCYSDAFIGNVFDSHSQGVPITMPIDQQSMVRAVQLESKISKGLYTRLGEDVNLLKKKITAQVSRSIASGLTYAQTAKALEGYTRIGYNRAIRIARTEGHRIQTTATMDAMEAAKERGADVVKQWDSTLDTKTRESHVAVDGEIRDLDKPFSNGLMYPGDPGGSAAEVINCRCALLQRAKWAVTGADQSFTKYNGISKQIESFDSPQTYGEFKTAFFSDGNRSFMRYVERMQDKYGTRDWRFILEKMSDREYKHYSKLLAQNPVYNKHSKAVETPTFVPAKTKEEAVEYARRFADSVDYSGISLDNVNIINEELTTLTEKYPTRRYAEIRQKKMKAKATANYDTLTINGQKIGHMDSETFAQSQVFDRLSLETLRKRYPHGRYPKDIQKQITRLEHNLRFDRWSVSSTHGVRATIAHEYGHTIADQYFGMINGTTASKNATTLVGQAARQFITDTRQRAFDSGDIYLISKYGATDDDEFFAEVFAMREMGETLPDYIEQMLDEVLKIGIV